MRKSILFAVPLVAAVLISACSDSGDDNSTQTPAQSYDVTGKIDYAGKTISSAKVCLDVNNNGLADDTACVNADSSGKYNFTSANNPAYYPLAAFIKETSGSAAVNAKIAVDSNEYDSILYAPRGKTDNISITTTLAKSLMDKDSTLTFDNAEKTADTIIKKADSPATVLTVYNNTLNTAPNSINISTSIRGLVSVITDKLSNEVEITDSTAISVSQVEIDTANSDIKEEDSKLPQEPAAPDNSTKTPLEKVTEMLAGAEIKNSAESPVNLNEYVIRGSDSSNSDLYIKDNAFNGLPTTSFFTQMSTLGLLNYNENGWPSDKQGFEVFYEDNDCYTFSNYHSSEGHSNACEAGKVNGITYKPIIDNATYKTIDEQGEKCFDEHIINLENPSQDERNNFAKCVTDIFYNNKNNIKIEKWYWTIDTTKLGVCK